MSKAGAIVVSPFTLDRIMQDYMLNMQRPGLTLFMQLITLFGSLKAILIISVITAAYLLFNGKRVHIGWLYVDLLPAYMVMLALKGWFGRSRPSGETLTAAVGYSFPSGHAMMSVALYGFLILLLCQKRHKHYKLWVTALLLLILLIGVSRIYLNVHYATDVLGGWFFGLAWLMTVSRIMAKVRP